MLAPSAVNLGQKSADSIESEQAPAGDLPWRIVAGPELSPKSLRAATVPDGPGGHWKGGSFERIEAQNRSALNAPFTAGAKESPIQVGLRRKPESFTVPVCDLPADLSIPAFLRQTPKVRRQDPPTRLAA
jgi:hypothetical protein